MHQTVLGLFPGQGSQKVGMGRMLYEHSDIARELFNKAEKALGFNLAKICFEGPAEKLTSTEIAQPAILTVSTICYEIYLQEANNRNLLAAAAGHSLGEYSALVAARALQFDDAVLLVHKRGKYMQEAVPSGIGSMYVVLGKEIAEIESAIHKVNAGVVQIANINAPGQVVIAGHKEALCQFKEIMSGAKIMELPVSAPFHCALMKPAEEKLRKDLERINISIAAFPVFSNFSASPISQPKDILDALTKQVCGRVRWVESIQNINEKIKPTRAIEFGSGNVLTGLMKRIEPSIERLNGDSIESIKNLSCD